MVSVEGRSREGGLGEGTEHSGVIGGSGGEVEVVFSSMGLVILIAGNTKESLII